MNVFLCSLSSFVCLLLDSNLGGIFVHILV